MRKMSFLASTSIGLFFFIAAQISVLLAEEDMDVVTQNENLAIETTAEEPYEANWVITNQPRCCSDCTFVAAGFKCKVKSCLNNCPWARSSAQTTTVPSF